mmetsp:Transcript_29539/g.35957  ORF Transcript_29539/g.35957 Transcript_29539/m.35957 type:complete len:83 (+) Transcript_29539:96-344(+)
MTAPFVKKKSQAKQKVYTQLDHLFFASGTVTTTSLAPERRASLSFTFSSKDLPCTRHALLLISSTLGISPPPSGPVKPAMFL